MVTGMNKKTMAYLSMRERQIMNIIYKIGKASVSDVQEEIPDILNYSTVRALLRILVEKKFLKFKKEGQKYIYFPATAKARAAKNAIKDLVTTYFNNSFEKAVVALLEHDETKLSEDEFERLSELINHARKKEE